MISQEVVLTQMELKLQQAKAAQTEAQLREALSALQVLCDVVLESTAVAGAVATMPAMANNVQSVQPMMQPVTSTQIPSPVEPSKFDDANGNSIFDF